MSRKPNKSKLTVQYEPIEGEGFFDVKPPPKVNLLNSQKGKELKPFFWMAFIIFTLLTTMGIAINGQKIFSESRNFAFAGFDHLREGAHALAGQDFRQAGLLFEGAEASFDDVSKNLRYLTGQANHYLKSDLYLDAAEKLISTGVAASKIGQQLAQVMEGVQDLPQLFVQQNLTGQASVSFTGLIREQRSNLNSILLETKLIQNNLSTLNAAVLPRDLKASIQEGQDQIGVFLAALREIDGNFETALTLLGDEVPHRYLVLLQNNHELRATGGFIGSYLIIDINDGLITKMETKDVYESDGQLSDYVAAPPGIDQLADRLFMRDANYSPDFPTSARELMWFLEHSRGPSVDTVIAIDQTVAEKLLELTGPITLANFPFQIRASNFNDLMSYHIESKLSQTSTPKQLLVDFIPVFKERLFSLKDFSRINDLITGLIDGRHIQAYSNEPSIQALAERFKVDGSMIAAEPEVDFLAVITTSIGGNKSDAFIQTQLSHHTEVAADGTLTDYLTIQKTHTWKESDFAYWKKLMDRYGTGKLHEETLRFIHGEGDNTDYMRVYVPKGSRLIGLEGVNIEDLEASEDLGYSVFAFTFGPLPAGQTQTVKLSYKLPHQLSFEPGDVYRFVAQKQAGSENITFKKSIETSDYLQVVQSFPVSPTSAFTLYPQYETAFDQNQIFLSAIAPAL